VRWQSVAECLAVLARVLDLREASHASYSIVYALQGESGLNQRQPTNQQANWIAYAPKSKARRWHETVMPVLS